MKGFLTAAMLCLLAAGCAEGVKQNPFHHSPLLGSRWKPLAPRTSPDEKADTAVRDRDASASAADGNLRERMVAAAEALLARGERLADFGQTDLEQMLEKAGTAVSWQAANGLDALVAKARNTDAYHTGPLPLEGDIVLFHNQWDANLNGELDDWLTGCGVVVARHRTGFEAVVRTGHGPRKVTVSPDGPGRRKVDDDLVNSYLRVPTRSDPEDTVYLAGQLYAGHIDIELLTEAGEKER